MTDKLLLYQLDVYDIVTEQRKLQAFLEDKSFQMYVEELQGIYSDILDQVDASQ